MVIEMMRRRMVSLVCLVLLLVVMETTTSASGVCTNFQTFNTKQIKRNKRDLCRLVDALKKSSSDYICLQEVWNVEDVSEIIHRMRSQFPYHYSALHEEQDKPATGCPKFQTNTTAACTVSDSRNIMNVMGTCGKECLSKSGKGELTYCLLNRCKTKLTSTNPIRSSCRACLFLYPEANIQVALKKCMTVNWNGPGLMVLSKRELQYPMYTKFFSEKSPSIERGYIQTTLATDIDVVCTHLSSIEGAYFEVDLTFDNYEAQQAAEIEHLGAGCFSENMALLGDLNTGPEMSGSGEMNLTAEAESNYKLLLQYGFTAPYVQNNQRCTYCSKNTLAGTTVNKLIDHVMVKGVKTFGAKRLYDNFKPPISDHYGVSLQVCHDQQQQ